MTTYATSVDFGRKIFRNDMSGFLHGIGANSPMDWTIAQLRPRLWRGKAGDTGVHARVVDTVPDIKYIACISDVHGYPSGNYGGNGSPWTGAGLTAWKATVETVTADHAGDENIIWNPWNEPEQNPQFFDGTQAQYFTVFKAAYDIIRKNLGPDAIIIGPSIGNYSLAYITAFLDFCVTNNMIVQGLDWHELTSRDADPSVLATNVAEIKALVAASYPTVGVTQYYLSETVGLTATLQPGDILNYLYYAGEADVDGICRACWDDSLAVNTCFNGSLTGLVGGSYPANNTRAAWWVYKLYADLKHSRVKCTTADANFVVLAGSSPATILVGYGGTTPSTVDTTMTIKNPKSLGFTSDTFTATIYAIPNDGEGTLAAPEYVGTETLTIIDGSATLSLTEILLHECRLIVLSP